MLSGFSSYFFGGNADGDQRASRDEATAVTAESTESCDWVFIESPGKYSCLLLVIAI